MPVRGDVFRGAFVEYNPYELKEYIISEIGHALKFNTDAMVEVGTSAATTVFSKYKYQPHHRIPIRKFSDTIDYSEYFEQSPQYSKYLVSEGTHRWRPILPIGIYEELGDFKKLGVSYPFLNDAHYPYKSVEFTIEPLLYGYSATTLNIINEFGDVCE